jgi:hypothetical protein
MLLRKRFWAEMTLGVISAVALTITAAWPDWIEAVAKVDPDGGNGSLEWAIVVVLVVSAVASPLLARREWRRARSHVSPTRVAPSNTAFSD